MEKKCVVCQSTFLRKNGVVCSETCSKVRRATINKGLYENRVKHFNMMKHTINKLREENTSLLNQLRMTNKSIASIDRLRVVAPFSSDHRVLILQDVIDSSLLYEARLEAVRKKSNFKPILNSSTNHTDPNAHPRRLSLGIHVKHKAGNKLKRAMKDAFHELVDSKMTVIQDASYNIKSASYLMSEPGVKKQVWHHDFKQPQEVTCYTLWMTLDGVHTPIWMKIAGVQMMLSMKPGDMLVFADDILHRGSYSKRESYRMHMYVDTDETYTVPSKRNLDVSVKQ